MDQIIASMISIFAIGLLFDRIMFSKLEDKVRDRSNLFHSFVKMSHVEQEGRTDTKKPSLSLSKCLR
jgi:hypothetical protein